MSAGELAPCLGIIEAEWSRVENQTEIASNSGEADVLELGEPFWAIDVSVNIRDRYHFDQWDSFLARRRLHDLTFTIYRTFRPYPQDKLITSDIGLTLDSISEASSTLTFSGFGPYRQANPGDMISYRTEANGYWVGQVTAAAESDEDGAVTVSVWPRPRTQHATTPAPSRIKALGEFRLIEAPRITEGYKRWDVKFKAEQVLR